MSNEIKEILDNVKKCCDITKEQSFTVYQRQEILKILDYITNLKEENIRLIEENIALKIELEDMSYEQLKISYKKLQEENKILKENAIHNDKVVDKAKWNEMIYKSRIDKAIEYLESYNTDFKNCRFGEAPISMRELGDLLDILKGEENE